MDLSRLKRRLLVYSGMNAVIRRSHRKPRVLFWHGVGSSVDAVICPEVFNVSLFKKQISYLNRHFDIISIHEFQNRLYHNSFSGKEVLLTFDDGYANNLYVVEPILSALELPFTIFISTDNISSGEFFPTAVNRLVTIASGLKTLSIPTMNKDFHFLSDNDRKSTSDYISSELKKRPLDEVQDIVRDLINNLPANDWVLLKKRFDCLKPLNWDEVHRLSRMKNVTIGSHCMWHICCHKNQKSEVVKDQILLSKQTIENHLQLPCDFFAYPNGNYTNLSNGYVGSAYKLGFSAETKTTVDMDHRNILPRMVGYSTDLSLYKILVSLS